MRLPRMVTMVVAVAVAVSAEPIGDRPVAAAEAGAARLLVVTAVNGYRHEVIPILFGVIERLGEESGLYVVDRADTNAELQEKTTSEALESYDAIVFANTAEGVPVADPEALVAWVESGGALVGIHGASTLTGWPEYTALLGAQFDYHREQATVKVRIDDASHPATRELTPGFEIHEEMYLYKKFDRERVHMLLSLDRHPNTGEPGFFPWAWTRVQGQGACFTPGRATGRTSSSRTGSRATCSVAFAGHSGPREARPRAPRRKGAWAPTWSWA